MATYSFQKRTPEEKARIEAEMRAELDAEYLEIERSQKEAGCIPHENLRRFRKSRRLTQEEMAKTLGVGRRTYQQYEDGTRSLPLPAMIKLAAWLDCDMNELVTGAPLPVSFSARTRIAETAIDAFRVLLREFPELSLVEMRTKAAFAAAATRSEPDYGFNKLKRDTTAEVARREYEEYEEHLRQQES